MRKTADTIILSAAVLLAACTKEPAPMQAPGPGLPETAAKIVNTPEDASASSILVCLDEESAAAAMAGRSLPEVDGVLDSLGAVSFERVMVYDPRDEELLKKYGLDRWYKVTFGEKIDPEQAAYALAGSVKVSKVQYNTVFHADFDRKAVRYVAKAQTVPMQDADFNDPYLGDQWHYYNPGDMSLSTYARAGADVNARDAWRLTCGDNRVIVAVLDEGVQYNHPDLAANMWTNPGEEVEDAFENDVHGYNFITGSGEITWDKEGDTGHGTHVAGTIAAVNNNGIGVCGIAGGSGQSDGVRIMTCQIFDGEASATADVAAAAIRYAALKGASIIQCSFGALGGNVTNDSDFEKGGAEAAALTYFIENARSCDAIKEENGVKGKGCIAIFAAGNEAYPMAAYPGAYKGMVSVTAIGCDGLPANYTNYGPGCDIAAPGGEYYTGPVYSESTCILSTAVDDGYAYMQGTSMACPHVSGVAALGLSYALKCGKSYTRDEFMSLLLTSVNDIDGLLVGTKRTMYNSTIMQMPLDQFKGNMGSGTIDAWRLLMQIEGTPVIPVQAGVSQEIGLEPYFGGGASSLLLNGATVSVSEDDRNAIGLQTEPYIMYGKLYIRPTRTGAAKLTVTALVGGDSENSSDTPSGQVVTREISVISRSVVSGNGGWL